MKRDKVRIVMADLNYDSIMPMRHVAISNDRSDTLSERHRW